MKTDKQAMMKSKVSSKKRSEKSCDDAYARAGVDRAGADHFVERIRKMTDATVDSKVKASIGGYASLYALDAKRWIAASTDGVGTKLKLGFELGVHHTVGIDLVAMSINDLLCVGAEPLFFLDYFATGKLDLQIGEAVLQGIHDGCRQAGCALVGGETAEMPDFYATGEYDLGGFAVGSVNANDVLPRTRGPGRVRAGDVIIGISSSGFHSNGFSLIRKLLAQHRATSALKRDALTPTLIYTQALLPMIQKRWIKGLAHITGSGFLNVPRISTTVDYEIRLPALSELPTRSRRLWTWLEKVSGLTLSQMTETFNCGVGMVLVCDPKRAGRILKALNTAKNRRAGVIAWRLGQTLKSSNDGKVESYVRISRPNSHHKMEHCVLHY